MADGRIPPIIVARFPLHYCAWIVSPMREKISPLYLDEFSASSSMIFLSRNRKRDMWPNRLFVVPCDDGARVVLIDSADNLVCFGSGIAKREDAGLLMEWAESQPFGLADDDGIRLVRVNVAKRPPGMIRTRPAPPTTQFQRTLFEMGK